MRALRVVAWIAAVLAVLYVAAALIVPRVVSADAWRPRIEERLSAIVGRPVALGELRLSLWTGIVVSTDRLTVSGTPSLAANSASVGLALGPLLRRQVRPRWLTAEGTAVTAGASVLIEDATIRARIGSEGANGTRVDGRVQGAVAAWRNRPLGEIDFELLAAGERVDVRSFVARVGAHVLEARAVIDGVGGPAPRAGVSGSARLAGITLSEIDAEIQVERSRATLERATFRAHGGTGSAHAEIRFTEPETPFELEAKVADVSVESLGSALSPTTAAPMEGTLSARLDLAGFADTDSRTSRLTGDAEIEIVRGSIRSAGLLEQAARLIEMAGGSGLAKNETPFDRIAATFVVAEGDARTSDLRFRSRDLDLDGGGRVALDGGIELDVVAAFSNDVSTQIAERTPQAKFRVGSDGRLTIPMNIRGSIGSPVVQIDLDRVLREGLQKELRERGKSGWLRKLLGRD